MGRVFKKKRMLVNVESGIVCDACKKSCWGELDFEYALLSANWGYDSKKDGEKHELIFCEACYDGLVRKLGLTPKVTNNFSDDPENLPPLDYIIGKSKRPERGYANKKG